MLLFAVWVWNAYADGDESSVRGKVRKDSTLLIAIICLGMTGVFAGAISLLIWFKATSKNTGESEPLIDSGQSRFGQIGASAFSAPGFRQQAYFPQVPVIEEPEAVAAADPRENRV
jgi:hypothetical protein